MVLAHRPAFKVAPVRGNVGTRLGKLDAGEYDAIILAAAGLNRLQLAQRITSLLPVEQMLPAAGQGALGVECRAGDERLLELLSVLNEPDVNLCVTAERLVSAGLGADCSAPLGCHAVLENGQILLRARLLREDGSETLVAQAQGASADTVSAAVVQDLLYQGAAELLAASSGH
jgi:hydroxymethylbilane synthase